MGAIEAIAIVAVLLCALAILPGTLGILMLTNKFAADAAGARLIYQHSISVLIVSVLLMLFSSFQAFSISTQSWLFIGSVVIYVGICAFGFLVHTRFLFLKIIN